MTTFYIGSTDEPENSLNERKIKYTSKKQFTAETHAEYPCGE